MPIFQISAVQNLRLATCKLPDGLDPWVYYAEARIRFWHVDTGLTNQPYPLRLDTGAEVSIIPETWFEGRRHLIGPLSKPMAVNTIGGSASGRMASDVSVCFLDDGRIYNFDFLLTSGLTRFGLLSLRDIHNQFRIHQSRRPGLAADKAERPLFLGDLVLTPWE
jgi:hypothetical protein